MTVKKAIGYTFICLLSFWSCKEKESPFTEQKRIYKSDLETIEKQGDSEIFPTSIKGTFIENAQLRTTEFAHSGKYSIKIDSIEKYVLNFRLRDLKKGEYFRFSAWQKKGCHDGAIVARTKGDNYYRNYRSYYELCTDNEENWIQHHLSFTLEKDVDKLDFYAMSNGRTAYFDDFKLERFQTIPKSTLSEKSLKITYTDSVSRLLNERIQKSLSAEIITASCKKYVDATLYMDAEKVNIKMKLKGDYTDHLESGKTSFRIKIKDDYAFRGLKEFSIQHAQTRNYLHEWFIHKLAEQEDVLSTYYDFTAIKTNEIDQGVYAVEEHFAKQLLERQNRREGPILKFDESGVWAYNYTKPNYIDPAKIPYFQACLITSFKKNKTQKSEQLKKNFEEGQILLHLFKSRDADIAAIFDMDQLAKYYAIIEFSGNNHGLAWHNRRFYYNPITQKLEHILFDILPFYEQENFTNILAEKLKLNSHTPEHIFDYAILTNEVFKERYFYYIEKHTQSSFIDSLFKTHGADLLKFETALKIDNPTYSFDSTIYYDNATYLRQNLAEFKLEWGKKLLDSNSSIYNTQQESFSPRKDKLMVADVGLNIYLKKNTFDFELTIENYHVNTVKVVAYQTKKTKEIIRLKKPILLHGYETKADWKLLNLYEEPKKIYYIPSNNPNIICSKKIIPWEKPQNKTTRMKLNESFNPNSQYYTINQNKVVFSGSIQIDKLLYIPEQYEVEIKPGTKIEFINGGGLIVTNSFYALGTDARPIYVFSKDSTSNGITVLNGGIAKLTHVNMDGISNLDYGKWELTGALTIYETETILNNCRITNNLSEDALNIIRSNFTINELTISNTTSDGFDADFCTGRIENSEFVNTGNDCIDFSGSTVQINSIRIVKAGDKGISGGERSTLSLHNINILDVITGIAAKDGSRIKGDSIYINNVQYGLAAFRKKPEYTGAFISVKKIKMTNATLETLIDLGSTIQIENEIFEGNEKLNIDTLYSRFN